MGWGQPKVGHIFHQDFVCTCHDSLHCFLSIAVSGGRGGSFDCAIMLYATANVGPSVDEAGLVHQQCWGE